MTIEFADALIAKYDVPGPRYTSYPTVPYWDGTPAQADWLAHIASALDAASGAQGASLYVHIPFCRSLCTFCGCNTRITRTHSIVMPYLNTLLAEFDIYLRALGRSRLELDELHLGGGTPTFLDEAELEALLSGLEARTLLRAGAVGSIEVDPRVTTLEQLIVLARHGFRRLSIGVQDFDPRVQDIVNRVQSEACVAEVARSARKLGFDSVNFDLIYGLPLQTEASVDNTIEAVCRLRPDRIALYGYAHVPWIRPGQRRFTDGDVPQAEQRRALYERSRERLEQAGYREVGLDHFALETDALWLAQQSGGLHRNFMGYTDRATLPLIGLGVSAIGDAGGALAQNEKDLRAISAAHRDGRTADPSRSHPRRRGPGAPAPHPAPDDAPRNSLGRAGRLHAVSGAAAAATRGAGSGRPGRTYRSRLPRDAARPRIPAQSLHGVRRPARAAVAGAGPVQPHAVARRRIRTASRPPAG